VTFLTQIVLPFALLIGGGVIVAHTRYGIFPGVVWWYIFAGPAIAAWFFGHH
jgi:hypothetical protein